MSSSRMLRRPPANSASASKASSVIVAFPRCRSEQRLDEVRGVAAAVAVEVDVLRRSAEPALRAAAGRAPAGAHQLPALAQLLERVEDVRDVGGLAGEVGAFDRQERAPPSVAVAVR